MKIYFLFLPNLVRLVLSGGDWQMRSGPLRVKVFLEKTSTHRVKHKNYLCIFPRIVHFEQR